MASKVFQIILLVLVSVVEFNYAEKSSDKVSLDVYYESLCPDSRSFFKDQLWPTYQKLGSKINLEMVPFGNAHLRRDKLGKESYACQHGPDECYGNIVQTCAIHLMNDTTTALKFILCAFKYRSQMNIIVACEHSFDMQTKLEACSTGPLGKKLEAEMARKTESLKPRHTFIPWTTINGKNSEEINNQALADLMQLVCNYLGTVTCEACLTGSFLCTAVLLAFLHVIMIQIRIL